MSNETSPNSNPLRPPFYEDDFELYSRFDVVINFRARLLSGGKQRSYRLAARTRRRGGWFGSVANRRGETRCARSVVIPRVRPVVS